MSIDIVTTWASNRIKKNPSPYKGKIYRIRDIIDRTAFNPNQLRTTLKIEYEPFDGSSVIETYLDERFNDELIIR